MDYEHADFKEALSVLAKKAGISFQGGNVKNTTTKYDKYYKMYDLALKLYQNNINSSLGKNAIEYLENRKISKDLIKEFKIYIKNFKKNIPIMLKYYILGILIMIISNLFISMIIGEVSSNESAVRENLFAFPVYTMLSIMIVAPLSEELVFRKSISPLIKNKWIYAVVCGLLFGGAHLLAGEFKLINLLYLIPYGSLGFVFALMNRETKTTFSSITMHCIHNTFTGLLLLITYSLGVL